MAKRKRTRAPKRDAVANPDIAPGESLHHTLRLRDWGLLAIFIGAALVTYSPALSGGLIWDDDAHVTKPELQSLPGLYRIWFDLGATQQYYPLLHSAFWLEHTVWGDSPLGYHLINVLQHALAAWLAYLILKRLSVPGALFAAAIFLLHPVHVESVAWITEQKNTLSAIFYLSAMLTYLNFDQSRSKRLYALALTLFVLGLLTKTVTATLPAALLVIFWWQRGHISWRRDVTPLLPWFALGAVAGIFTAWVERTLIGADGTQFDLSFVDRGLLAGRVIWFYVAKLVWPVNLTFIYPRWQIDTAVWWQWLFPMAVLGMLALLWKFRNTSRAPLAAWLFFTGTLFPVLGFLNVYPFIYSFVADHFQYLASLGLIALAAAGLSLGIAELSLNRRFSAALGLVLLAILATLSWRQSRAYSDIVNLYQTTLDRNPDCWMAHNNLGVALADKGLRAQAIDHYHAAMQLRPNYPEVHVNLGAALVREGRASDAIEQYRTALTLKPNYAEAHNNLGIALFNQGLTSVAIDEYQAALRLKHLPTAHNNLGVALLSSGQLPEAREQFQAAINLQPNFADAHSNLGIVFVKAGQIREAIPQFELAVRLNPTNLGPRMNLAGALLQAKEPQRAIEQLQDALAAGADEVKVYFVMAMAYTQLNQATAANAMAQKAIAAAQATEDAASIEQIQAWMKVNGLGTPETSSKTTP